MKGFSKWFAIVLAASLFVVTGCTVSSGDGSSHDLATVTPVSTSVKKYSITIADGITNGTVTADKQTAAEGEKVTLSISPSANFVLKSISVTDSENNLVSVTENGNTGSFTVPASNINVNATFITFVGTEYFVTDYRVVDGNQYARQVFFGDWPQTIKASNVTVYKNKSISVGIFTYFLGSDGAWYAKISENAVNSELTYTDGSAVGQNGLTEKWFKVEKLKWRVLTSDYNGTGMKLLFAEKVLIGKPFNSSTSLGNNYENSDMRAWINGDFFNTAFTANLQKIIKKVSVRNDALSTNPNNKPRQWNDGWNQYASDTPTSDNVFLLSEQEVTTEDYEFTSDNSTRQRFATDYAKASGSKGDWWLRSPYYDNSWSIRFVNVNGLRSCLTVNKAIGVVPALCVNK